MFLIFGDTDKFQLVFSLSLAALPASSRTSAARDSMTAARYTVAGHCQFSRDSFVFLSSGHHFGDHKSPKNERVCVCVYVWNSIYSVCAGKGSSQSKHKHKHKRSCVSPSRAEPTIVGTLHTPPSLADAKRWRRRGIWGMQPLLLPL